MLIIRGARLYDGTGAPVVDDAVLVAEGARIAYVGAARGAPVADGADVIDADGRALIPGLIDCHVHICFDASPDFEAFAAGVTPEGTRELCVENVGRALRAGVTTVRDLGGIGLVTVEIARAVAEGSILGARVRTAGQVLTAPKGHGHFIGREISSGEEMVSNVASLADAGAECVKMIATGGVLTKGVSAKAAAFPEEQMAMGVAEAHARGLRVAAHAIGEEGIEAAVAAGVDSIEHGCFLTDKAIAGMRANPSWLVATLSAPDRISNGGDGVPEYARAKSAEVQVSHRSSFAKAVAAGIRIASGTDAGTPYNFIGNLHYELRLMHESGMPLERILPAATFEAAALLGLDDEIGTLEGGKIADCVLLDGDPLADVGAYAKPSVVVKSGRAVRP